MRLAWQVGLGLSMAAFGASTRGIAPVAAQGSDTVTIAPGPQYSAGWFHRWLFGSHYRDLWTTPLRVPVLDLDAVDGGLTPLRKGGGTQTTSLRFRAASGREYTFRSVDKDASALLPEELRGSVAGELLRDQTSASHPAAALVVAPLLDAVGVLHAKPRLVVMPDSPKLGAFRREFAGMLGLLEERPNEAEDRDMGFAGAVEIVGSESFLRRLENTPGTPVDDRAFLAARLMDVYLGDWDRHQDQWRWALVDDSRGRRWVPIPRDRDQAFARYDGLLLVFARQTAPQLLNFGPKYGNPVGMTWNGRDLDRRLLTGLTWLVWDSTARALQGRLTDDAIAAAVGALPPAYQAIDRDRLRTALVARRDHLPEAARRYYRVLAGEVDVHASDLADSAVVDRVDGASLRVRLWAPAAATPYYDRTFTARETDEVRIWLHGGDDRGIVRGDGGVRTLVRFLGGGGNDRFIDSARVDRARFYDARGENAGVGHEVNAKPYLTAADTMPGVVPPRDWGRGFRMFPNVTIAPDVGLVVGIRPTFYRYGFRTQPYASRVGVGIDVATGASSANVMLGSDWRLENSSVRLGFDAGVSGFGALRWYGLGNETSNNGPEEFFRVRQHVGFVAPHLAVDFGKASSFTIGPRATYSVTELDDGKNARRFIGQDRPFGAEAFGEAGAVAQLVLDGRDQPVGARRGVALTAAASVYPFQFGDVSGGSFGGVQGEVMGYLTPGHGEYTPTFSLRLGGKKVWGDVPFFEAAFLGGNTSRGFRPNRFAGDGVLYANGEARIKVADLTLFLPGDFGVFGLGDVGRVYQEGESSSKWHSGGGGGVWFGLLERTATMSLAVAEAGEGVRFYFQAGFGF